MKRVLILGGSHRDIPLIEAAKELGYFTLTLGDRDYYLGHNYSHKAYRVNFNDLDAVREIIKEENIDYLLPGSGEESYLNTVELSHQLGIGNFDSVEVAKLVHNKWQFKKFCLDNGISTPKGFYYNKEDITHLKDLPFPIVVKPTNLSGGRGVDIVKNHLELEQSLENAYSVSDEIFLEEFIDGKLIAYSIFLKDQKIIYGFSGEDKTYLNPYLITTAYPLSLAKTVERRLIQDIEKLADLLQLANGMFHLQVLIKDNTPYIIDVTRRIPGDLYPYLIEYCDGVQYSKAVVKAYTTGDISDEFDNKYEKQKFVIRHVVMPDKNGVYEKIVIDDSLADKIIDKLFLVSKGDIIENYSSTQIAIVFIQLEEKDTNILNNLDQLIYPIVNKKDAEND